VEKISDSREFLPSVLAQAYSTAEIWTLDKTSLETRCGLSFLTAGIIKHWQSSPEEMTDTP